MVRVFDCFGEAKQSRVRKERQIVRTRRIPVFAKKVRRLSRRDGIFVETEMSSVQTRAGRLRHPKTEFPANACPVELPWGRIPGLFPMKFITGILILHSIAAAAQQAASPQPPALATPATPAPRARPVASAPIRPMTVLSKRTWPASLKTPDGLTNAHYVESASKEGRHVYRSRRFEYVLHASSPLSEAVMKDVARVFEGTYELLSQSPWGVQAQPVDGYFRAHLYETKGMYHAAGGMDASSGFYNRAEKLFHVPLDSLGLKKGSSGYVKDRNYQVKTLVHEITHMMMHDILDLLPRWLIEGTAEYTGCIPFRSGTFEHAKLLSSVKAYNELRFSKRMGGGPPIASFRDILRAPPPGRKAPAAPAPEMTFYHASLLLTYYFMHLDGDGKGTRLLKFLDAVRADKPKVIAYNAAITAYVAAMDQFLKKPGVKSFPGGRFEYPSNLTPPRAPEPFPEEYRDERIGWVHLKILLDGRTVDQVAGEASAALHKLGLRALP